MRRRAWRTGSGLLVCATCRRATSVTAGTIFHRSRVGLRTWFAAAWLASEGSEGVSALEVQRLLGLGSYETAWAMLHRLRRVMATAGPRTLGGNVEVGTIEVEVVERAARGVLRNGAATVVIAVESKRSSEDLPPTSRLPRRPERTAVGRFPPAWRPSPDATVRTADAPMFRRIAAAGFRHEIVSGGSRGGARTLAALGQVESSLEGWISGPLHRGVSDAHLAYYLDELAFRWNTPSPPPGGARFNALLELAVRYEPAPFRDLVGGTSLPL